MIQQINNLNFEQEIGLTRSNLCNYIDAYVIVKGTLTVPDTSAADAPGNDTNKIVIFKNCALFTNCISKVNNTQVYVAEHIDIVIPMYSLVEYSDAF